MLKRIESILAKINTPLADMAVKVSGLLFVVMVVVVLIQVLCRYILNMPLSWTDEISRYLMIYMTYLCLPVIYLQDGNIAMTFLLEKIQGTRFVHLILAVTHVMALALFVIWIWFGWVFFQTGSVMADSLPIPMYVIYIIPPVMLAVTCLSALQKLIYELHVFLHYHDENGATVCLKTGS